MRKPSVTLGIAAIALIAFSLACNFSTGNNNNNSNNNNASPSPTPAKSAGAATPTECFKTFYNALKDKDAAALKTVMQKADLTRMEDQAKKKNQSLDEFIRGDVIPDMSHDLPPSLPETRNEKIDGERATLEFLEKGDWKTGRFTKESDGWKVDI